MEQSRDRCGFRKCPLQESDEGKKAMKACDRERLQEIGFQRAILPVSLDIIMITITGSIGAPKVRCR
jgi:hypothetical protein